MTEPRPVYIQPEETARVTLTGNALTVEIPGQTDHWLPLSRISRLVVSHKTLLDTPAILACAGRGITIVMHDENSAVIARMIGQGGRRTDLRQRLTDAVSRPDWRERYSIFLNSLERRYCRIVARRVHAPEILAMKPARLRAWLGQQATECVGKNAAEQTRRLYRRQTLAWMSQTLVELGLDARNEKWLVGNPDLAQDLGKILALRMETARLGWLRAIQRKGGLQRPLTEKAIIRKTEQLRPRANKISLDIVNRLHTWLVDLA